MSENGQIKSVNTTSTAVPIALQEAKSLTLEEQEEGVKGIRETFPEIHQTVAELTLKVCDFENCPTQDARQAHLNELLASHLLCSITPYNTKVFLHCRATKGM